MIALWIAAAVTAAQPADIVIVNADVFTADPVRPHATAVAVAGGKIVAVGDADTVAPLVGPRTRRIDAKGKQLIPGITAAHEHVPRVTLPGTQLRFESAGGPPDPTPDELLAAVKNAPGTGWITGSMWFKVADDATRAKRNWRLALDAVAPDRPVLILSWGHPVLFNSRALRELGIDPRAPDPTGGAFGRDADGRLAGWGIDAAGGLLLGRMFDQDLISCDAAEARVEAQRYLRWGITSVGVMGSNCPTADLRRVFGREPSRLKWNIYVWQDPAKPAGASFAEVAKAPAPTPHVRIVGVKYVLDGSPFERWAYQREDYADRPGWRGRPDYGDAELRTILRGALVSAGQTALHVVGDGAMDQLLAAMTDVAPAAQWRAKRVRIEHGSGIRPDMIAKVRDFGLVVAGSPFAYGDPFNPEQQLLDNGVPHDLARYGARHGAKEDLTRSLVDAGVFYAPVAFDGEADDDFTNPLRAIAAGAVMRRDPVEALSREQMLTGVTYGGAYTMRAEGERGAIKPGLAADLALLPANVLTAPLAELPKIHSVLTLVDGAIAYEEPPAKS